MEIGHLCFTPDLVWVAAWGSLRAIPELDLPFLQRVINQYAGTPDAGGVQADQFLTAFNQATELIVSDRRQRRDERCHEGARSHQT